MRGIHFLRLLLGENKFTADMRDSARLLNLCMEYGIVYRGFGSVDENTVSLTCSSYSSAALTRLCRQKGIEIKKTDSRGIPPAIYRYRRRVGLLVGVILGAILISVSDNVIWDIEVSGNERVTYSRVLEALSAEGFGVGTPIDGLDVDKIKTRVMINSEDISWMSINIVGTVAHVEIREEKLPNINRPMRPANIVAARDGYVEHLEVFHGDATVRSGEAVRKGDILISGVRDSKTGGFSVTRASGSVFAVTEHTFRVEIPYEYEKKEYSESQKSEFSVIFFGKEVKVLKYSGNEGEFCDTIESVDMLTLPGGARAPIGVRRVTSVAYAVSKEKYTPEEAMEIAYYRLERMISAELPEAQLLHKKIETEIGENAYILVCTVRCIEDIAEVAEFDAELS